MAVGAYTSALVTTTLGPKLGWSGPLQQWLLFPASLALGGLLAAVAGFAIGAPSLRLKGDYLAIVTLGFGEIIKVIFQNVEAVGGARGLIGVPSYTNLFWTFGAAAVTVYVVWAMVNSTFGRGFLAVADDEVAAEAMGLNTTRYKITAFMVGSFFAGVAGGLYAHLKGYLNPSGFDFTRSIEIVVMVILGGMGKHVGVIAAAILLTVVQEPLRKLGDFRMILYAILLIGVMLFRYGSREVLFGYARLAFSPRGRIGRANFAIWVLSLSLISIPISKYQLERASREEFPSLDWILFFSTTVIFLWMRLAMLSKRLRDQALSPWMMFLFFVPLINFWFIFICFFRRGTIGPNKYGSDPLA
jgi:branched-chain amino acid transport system permease protein